MFLIKYFGILNANIYCLKIVGAIKVVDNTNLNSDIKIRFALDPESNHGHTYQCNSENSEEGFSEDNFECTGTDNDDVIWVKVLVLMQMNFISYIFVVIPL